MFAGYSICFGMSISGFCLHLNNNNNYYKKKKTSTKILKQINNTSWWMFIIIVVRSYVYLLMFVDVFRILLCFFLRVFIIELTFNLLSAIFLLLLFIFNLFIFQFLVDCYRKFAIAGLQFYDFLLFYHTFEWFRYFFFFGYL